MSSQESLVRQLRQIEHNSQLVPWFSYLANLYAADPLLFVNQHFKDVDDLDEYNDSPAALLGLVNRGGTALLVQEAQAAIRKAAEVDPRIEVAVEYEREKVYKGIFFPNARLEDRTPFTTDETIDYLGLAVLDIKANEGMTAAILKRQPAILAILRTVPTSVKAELSTLTPLERRIVLTLCCRDYPDTKLGGLVGIGNFDRSQLIREPTSAIVNLAKTIVSSNDYHAGNKFRAFFCTDCGISPPWKNIGDFSLFFPEIITSSNRSSS